METFFIITGAVFATLWGVNKLAEAARQEKARPANADKHTSIADFFLYHENIESLRDVHVDTLAKEIGSYDVCAEVWDYGRWQYGWHTEKYTVRADTISGHIKEIDMIKHGSCITRGESLGTLLEAEKTDC